MLSLALSLTRYMCRLNHRPSGAEPFPDDKIGALSDWAVWPETLNPTPSHSHAHSHSHSPSERCPAGRSGLKPSDLNFKI